MLHAGLLPVLDAMPPLAAREFMMNFHSLEGKMNMKMDAESEYLRGLHSAALDELVSKRNLL
jgi:hypothetical protein